MSAPVANESHNEKVKNLFSSISPGYDFLNHTLSMGLDIYWRRQLIRSLKNIGNGTILDLAAGTFDVTVALGKAYPNSNIIAADLCFSMLEQGLPKLERAKKSGKAFSATLPITADAFNLPLPDNSLAAITIAFGLRNMEPRAKVLPELLRVLKPGGRLSVLEFGSAKTKVWFGLYNFYLAHILPRIGGLVSGERTAYDYLAETIYNFPSAANLATQMQDAGFATVGYTKLSGGIVYLHCADKTTVK